MLFEFHSNFICCNCWWTCRRSLSASKILQSEGSLANNWQRLLFSSPRWLTDGARLSENSVGQGCSLRPSTCMMRITGSSNQPPKPGFVDDVTTFSNLKNLPFFFFNWQHYVESQDGYAKKGCSMVEIMAIQVQRPHWFVSHAWIEPWIGKLSRLFETVLLHCLLATSFFFHPGSNNSYIKGRTWATVQIASQGSFCTKKWSWANLFVFAFILWLFPFKSSFVFCSCIC